MGQVHVNDKEPLPVENGQASRLLPVDSGGKSAGIESKEDDDGTLLNPKVYRRRWIILGLFCIYSMSSAYQWIHLNIIGNIILRYYNESLPGDTFQQETAIDWLSMIYMLAYIPLIFPATWLLDKKGLRIVVIIGSLLNALGAWLKCASVSEDRFALLMTAQTICAIAQIFVLGIPARLAAVWFGPNEVSTATSLGVFGNQVGVAVGFLIPPVIVPNSPSLDQVGYHLSLMFYGGAAITSLLFIIIIFVFKNEPPHAPSRAQLLAVRSVANEHYGKSLINLIKNKGFILLTISYGINTGSYYAISTLLNPIVLFYFEGKEKEAGEIGLTIVLAGIAGAVVAGIWLDKTKIFKATTVAIYFLSMAGMIVFTFTLDLHLLWVVFLAAGSLGLFMTGYLPVGFEFAAEITYPESEGTSSGLLNASAQFFGIILTIGMRSMLNRVGVLGANSTVSGALFLGLILTAFISPEYKRQKAGEEAIGQLDLIEINVEGEDKTEEEF